MVVFVERFRQRFMVVSRPRPSTPESLLPSASGPMAGGKFSPVRNQSRRMARADGAAAPGGRRPRLRRRPAAERRSDRVADSGGIVWSDAHPCRAYRLGERNPGIAGGCAGTGGLLFFPTLARGPRRESDVVVARLLCRCPAEPRERGRLSPVPDCIRAFPVALRH